MTHFWKRDRNSNEPDYLYAWCGRIVRRNTVVTVLTQVECQLCRKAFAKTLRELPDVFPKEQS